jgi:hypothetical protein
LLFVATAFGIWYSIDGGTKWMQFKNGLPVIPFRDLAIQKRENDLVAASFGRGFYILDDYSPLRQLTSIKADSQAVIFPVKPALWYFQRQVLGDDPKASQGDAFFVADNPPFGAVFTYYLANELKSIKKIRQEKEADLRKNEKDIPFPGWEALEKERRSLDPSIWLVIKDLDGKYINRIEGVNTKGINRVSWNLRAPSASAIQPAYGNWTPSGPMVLPGNYQVEIYSQVEGVIELLAGPEEFEVKQLREGSLEGAPIEAVGGFWNDIEKVRKSVSAASVVLNSSLQKLDLMQKALNSTPINPVELQARIEKLRLDLLDIDAQMNGNRSKQSVGEMDNPTINERLSVATMGSSRSTYGPTPMLQRSLDIARIQMAELREKLEKVRVERIPELQKELIQAGAPWIDGMPLPE